MSHNHTHHHENLSGKKLIVATILNFLITLVQIIGGIISNSLSLLSDAAHNFGDASAILIAYFANKMSNKKFTNAKTFGFKRIEILAALFNAIVLIAISFALFFEAWRRFNNPEPVKGLLMLTVAVFGLIANLLAVLILKKDSEKNINVRAAYLHLLGDTLSSVAVIAGGILIYFFEIYWIDPAITVLVGIYITYHTLHVVKETIDILMQFTPEGLNLEEVQKSLLNFEEIENIHHVHAWNLTDQQVHFECHIDLKNDLKVSETEILARKIQTSLHDNFDIDHVILQFEYNCCENKEMVYKNEHFHE